jgi:hypothetical protein
VWKKVSWVLVLTAAVLLPAASAQDKPSGKKGFFSLDNWQIDLYGGWAAIDPGGLNIFPQYYEKTIPFLNLESYQYNKQIYGSNYIYSASLDARNSFKKITTASPIGFAIRYHISRRLDLSLGLSYITRKAKSFYHATITTGSIPPNAYGTWGLDDIDVRDLTYDDISVSVKSWIPAAGIHYRFFSAGFIHGELEAAAGPAFAAFTQAYHLFDKFTFPNSYWAGNEVQGLGKGKGVGIALSGGGRLSLGLLSRFEVFVAAAYQFVSVPTLTGSLMSSRRYLDVESVPPQFTTAESTGTWRSYPGTYSRNWGRLTVDYPVISNNPSQYPNGIDINLSGVSLRLGVSVRL